jgi:glyoxylase-like metal-dependent hydrolase (beta-lactamase superfamily II)
MPTDVHAIKVCRGMFKNYSYLGIDAASKDSFLVDPAWELDKIEGALSRSGFACRFILLTHSHFDHVDLADELGARLDIPVYMSKVEAEAYQFRCRNLVLLREEDSVPFGAGAISPMLTPGHTKGSTCFLFEDSLFTGDTLFFEGCGMCAGEGADPKELFRSIQRLKASIDPHTRIYPGHSYGKEPGQRFAMLLHYNIYLQFEQEKDFVAYRMRAGQTGWANFA